MRSSYAKQRLNERLQGVLAELQAAEADVPKACNRQSPRVVAVRGASPSLPQPSRELSSP